MRGRRVYFVGSEEAANTLAALELAAARCTVERWSEEYAETLRGAEVVILPINDDTGRQRADFAAGKLGGVAASVRLLELPGLSPGGDVSDWLEAGGTPAQLEKLTEGVPPLNAREIRERAAAAEAPEALPHPVCALNPPRPEPIEWEVHDLITRGAPCLFVGAGGARKTTTLLHIALAIAGGHRVFGRYATTRGPVLFISEEDSFGVLHNRAEAFVRGHGWDRVRTLENLHVLAHGGVRLPSDKWEAHLTKIVGRLKPRAVVFDPWHELRDGREDSADDTKSAVRTVKSVCAAAGATALIVHHPSKPAEGKAPADRVRGSSHLINAQRTAYLIEERDSTSSTLTCLKLSRAERPAPFVITYSIQSAEENRAEWESASVICQSVAVAAANRAEAWVLQQLDESPEAPNSSELKNAAKGTGISGEDVSRALANLNAGGIITFDPGPRSAKLWKRSTLPDAPGNQEELTLPTLPRVAGQGEEPPASCLPAPVGGKASWQRGRLPDGKVSLARVALTAEEEPAEIERYARAHGGGEASR